MIRNIEKLNDFEKKRIKETPISIEKNFQIFALLKKEAQLLGIWNISDISNLKMKIKIANALNNVR